jgi:High-affinity nickel-transport protein
MQHAWSCSAHRPRTSGRAREPGSISRLRFQGDRQSRPTGSPPVTDPDRGARLAWPRGLHALRFFLLIALVAPHHYPLAASLALTPGVVLTAYSLGVRHAFDADHISAIKNTRASTSRRSSSSSSRCSPPRG